MLSDMPITFVSILMLTYNAPEYIEMAVRSVAERTTGVDYELVVVDNASEQPARELVTRLHDEGLIHKLKLMDYNSLFAEGNNVAASIASDAATHYLLLNSDVEVRSEGWLSHLLSAHERGVTSYGVALDPLRVDGYSLLIDADLYRETPLDEGHQWWWSVTKQQAVLLNAGHAVRGFAEHERWLHHFGGKSGSAFKNAKGMDVSREEVSEWFGEHRATVIDRRPDGTIPGHEERPLHRKFLDRLTRTLRG